MQNVNEKTFEKLAKQNPDKYILLYFTANWCPPCSKTLPIITTLSSSILFKNKILFLNVDVDFESNLTKKYNIRNVPTILILKNKETIFQFVGLTTFETLNNTLLNLL